MSKANLGTRLALIIALTLTPAVLSAHPHMFLTSEEELVWDKATLTGCWIEWTFDQFFSADIIQAYDANHDGKFSAEETKKVYDGAFINLKNYYYFTFIRQGKTRTNPPSVTAFTAVNRAQRQSDRIFKDH